jgi:hypothetical protein
MRLRGQLPSTSLTTVEKIGAGKDIKYNAKTIFNVLKKHSFDKSPNNPSLISIFYGINTANFTHIGIEFTEEF